MTAARACSGLASSLSSRNDGSGVGWSDGVARRTRRVKSPVMGRKTRVAATMTKVCRLAAWRRRLSGAETVQIHVKKGQARRASSVLSKLNSKWLMATRQAPIRMGSAAMMGTMHVPIWAPITTTATWWNSVKTPALTSAKLRPIMAPDDVSRAVNRAERLTPTKRPVKVSPWICAKRGARASLWGAIAEEMVSMPRNSKPNPIRAPPSLRQRSEGSSASTRNPMPMAAQQ